MVQLKQVALRLKSIRNIQKITKTMKMVSASKMYSSRSLKTRFTRAERELQAARPFGYGPRKFYQSSHLVKGELEEDKDKKAKEAKKEETPPPAAPTDKPEDKEKDKKIKRVYVAITSDRGLCGGVHSGVARRIRREMVERSAEGTHHKLVCVGDKSRTMLRRQFAAMMLVSVKEVGRLSPTFKDASIIAAHITESGFAYDIGQLFYNKYYSPVKYELTVMPVFTKFQMETAPNITAFDDIEEDMLEMFAEFTLASLVYYTMKESTASEQSARMAAMDNATKNASEMIRKLQLLYNRTRQAVITRELIEIISGAAALK